MEAIIPTHNDYIHLPKIVKALFESKKISKVRIVDNKSSQQISSIIKTFCKSHPNIEYHYCRKLGKGNAIAVGISSSSEDILFVDADIENFSEKMVARLLVRFSEGFDLVKANISRANGQSNTAFILCELKRLLPNLKVERPTCGIFCVKRDILDSIRIPAGWSVDLSILVQAYLMGCKISEVNLGEIKDKPRSEESLEESRKDLHKELSVVEVLLDG